MSPSRFLPIIAVATLLAFAEGAHAQSSLPAPGSSVTEASGTVLRIQLIISRFVGEKKISSIPYTFNVTTGNVTTGRSGASIRMGVEMPIANIVGGASSVVRYSVGTNIDCQNVTELPGGRYTFGINVQNTAAIPDSSADWNGSPPMIRNFSTSFSPSLRDGQTVQSIASSDPVTGEVVKIDVTLNVVK